ncbi:chromate transporter [Flammeovirgaceae bacterium SG7u.111]|nr:chromate transporter [Flammeovirgaceae bacterium SG7u.132]WPO37729.1 chromate transporter [Flammeovirgaceae bacterium SG7u.111]
MDDFYPLKNRQYLLPFAAKRRSLGTQEQTTQTRQKNGEYFQLLTSFLKVGFFMFGGGYAMLPLLEKELIDYRKWITEDELLEIISLSQMTPGTIAINAATHIGNTRAGVLGGVLASFGIIFPSLLIITLIYYFAGAHFENLWVQKAFLGIRACLVAMIANSVYKMFKTGVKGAIPFLVFLLAVLCLFLHIHPILIILAGAVIGLVVWGLVPYMKAKGRAGL